MIVTRRDTVMGVAAALTMPALARAADATAWLNPPKAWKTTGAGLTMRAETGSDFWRKTLAKDAIMDSGHLFFREVSGDFVSTVTVEADYAGDADQTGLMVRADAANWMKTGVEWLHGKLNSATVFTRDWSDGSVVPLPGWTGPIRFRVSRRGPILACAYAKPGEAFVDVRLGHLAMGETVQLGLTACAPFGKPFEARFADWTVEKPQAS
jgi:regulation of enolase protein 1 (concanavalin A-like superfamily)